MFIQIFTYLRADFLCRFSSVFDEFGMRISLNARGMLTCITDTIHVYPDFHITQRFYDKLSCQYSVNLAGRLSPMSAVVWQRESPTLYMFFPIFTYLRDSQVSLQYSVNSGFDPFQALWYGSVYH